jgi:hypothetical protein
LTKLSSSAGSVAVERAVGAGRAIPSMISVQASASGLLNVLESVDPKQTDKGIFVYDGTMFPW